MFLQVQNLTKKFNHKTVVKNVDLSIKKGDLVAFLGPNGAGKSTTINMLIGIIQPTQGQISLNGFTPQEKAYRQKIGVVFQESILDDDLTVRQNLMIRRGLYQHLSNNLDYWIEKFALQKIIDQKYRTLSGGQKRRVDIVRALLHEPEVLFLDEPTTGLDIQTRELIWQVLNELRREMNLTIILTTHYLEEAEEANFVYVIDHGEIIASDSVENLKCKYAQNRLTMKARSKNVQLPGKYQYQRDGYKIFVSVSTSDCLEILSQLSDQIVSFDYRQGNMDYIFLNLTGREVE